MRCIITGLPMALASAGMRVCRAGYQVVGIDRDTARLAQTRAEFAAAGYPLPCIVADLAQPDAVADAVRILAASGPFDVLIHNAGINAVGHFAASNLARQRAVLRVNLLAPLLLTQGIVQAGLLRDGGALVLIASLSHYVGYLARQCMPPPKTASPRLGAVWR
ncbi:MAG: SDR family oxidoreductase [Chloroflexaceae bacterium]|nr:SDR family oxidoreductase [Chloroflexaceae bacterium]